MIHNTVKLGIVFLMFFAAAVSSTLDENYYMGPCTTPDSESGICIALSKCKVLFNIVKQKAINETTIQFLQQSQCGSVGNKILVCCSVNLPEPGKCGIILENRVYGGHETNMFDHPWMALIIYETYGENKIKYRCGGSLINSRYVLTAAHCIESRDKDLDRRPTHVRLGDWDLTTNPDCIRTNTTQPMCFYNYVDIPINKTCVHQDYKKNSKNAYSDIALIRLEREVAYTEFIQPICLPITDSLKRDNFEGFVMDALGWGATEDDSPSNKLLKAALHIKPLEDCQKIYTIRYKRELHKSHICAGGEDAVDTCSGDSGGPLIGIDFSKYFSYRFIAGITSFGLNSNGRCGNEGWPGIYVKVGDYIDWIKQKIVN